MHNILDTCECGAVVKLYRMIQRAHVVYRVYIILANSLPACSLEVAEVKLVGMT